MFNFSANYLSLLLRKECHSCVVFVMKDHSTNRAYRLHDFTKSQTIAPGRYYCVSGNVNSADKLYLVIERVRPDTKHGWASIAQPPADGADRAPYELMAPVRKHLDPQTALAVSPHGRRASLPRPTKENQVTAYRSVDCFRRLCFSDPASAPDRGRLRAL